MCDTPRDGLVTSSPYPYPERAETQQQAAARATPNAARLGRNPSAAGSRSRSETEDKGYPERIASACPLLPINGGPR